MARYKKAYSSRSVSFVIPLVAMMFVGGLYVLASRTAQDGASFILVTVAAGLAVYWVRELYKMSRPEAQKRMPREQEQQKDWVYDLIKNNEGEMVFVAEVPGPEEQINVRLLAGVLKIRGGQNFTRDVQLEGMTTEMGISDYKYRNGVLTIKMQKV
ncbi:Hsp20/alpha crystallin family protein [Nitrososphaera sp.]|uniref:Hsp20/alpha crystallin family protein n=1 Tax=Nitrososphaera sp. TaxID=1971748 RepID=UPI00307CCD93